MPQLFWRDRHIVGFDPAALEELVAGLPGERDMIEPPGNSLAASQGGQVVEPGADLGAGLQALLARIAEEIDFNDAKGTAPYRLGMHDGLRFAEDAIADLLRRHGHRGRDRGQAHRQLTMDSTDALRELADRQAIADLIHAYCFHFDNNEPDAVAALFTEDATVDYGPEAATIVGSAAIATTIAVGLERTFAATSHHVSNIQITFDGPDQRARRHVPLRLAPLRRRLARRRALGPLPPSPRPHRCRLAFQRAPSRGGRHGRLPPRDDAPDRPPLSSTGSAG